MGLLGLLLLIFLGRAEAQNWLGQWSLSGPTESRASLRFAPDYVSPEVHKWYDPAHLPETYVQPWYQMDTQYSQEQYRRYVDAVLEGAEWTDNFGRPLGRGLFVYSWEQTQAQPNGSLIRKAPASSNSPNPYASYFQNLLIASDKSRRGSFQLMVGSAIGTQFTPLTLVKPGFNGMRLDYAAERWMGSLILSRPSAPNNASRTNITQVMGGHGIWQAGPQANLGLTYVNAHTVQTQRDFSFGNPMRGSLSTAQLQPLKKLWVRIRDDSPEESQSGPRLFQYDIVLEDTSGRELRGREIGFLPRVEGGRLQDGALAVEGSEAIVLEYDLAALDYAGVKTSTLRRASVELALADDYQIEVASDQQTDGERRNPAIVFLPVQRAAGNVRDDSNSRVLLVDYGLPTANEVLGLDWNIVEWHGLSLQGETALNRRYTKYPGPVEAHLHQRIAQAHAAYLQAAYQRQPWFLWGEFFSMAADYTTRYWLVQGKGEIKYRAPIPEVYEFVEDDDDLNAIPEWVRPFQPTANRIAFPSYDENSDFVYDYNQNRNLFPDYEEPFLRFRADRPEFLFGLDLNYNGAVDRFENDDLPDYPYKADHRGYNLYLRGDASPELSGTLGVQRMKLISGDGRTRSLYTLGKWVHPLSRGGQLRLFAFGALVRDDIRDEVEEWVQPVGALGRMQELRDALPARHTWKSTLYADWDQRPAEGLRLLHRFKWEYLRQRDADEVVRLREGRPRSGFLGIIDKAEWTLPLGLGVLEPRWKSEFRRDRPYSSRLPVSSSLEETASLLWTQPLMAERTRVNYYARYGRQLFSTELETGIELGRLWLLEGWRDGVDRNYTGFTWVAQFTNQVGYLGYKLVSRLGVQWTRRHFAGGERQQHSLLFVTIHAGLN